MSGSDILWVFVKPKEKRMVKEYVVEESFQEIYKNDLVAQPAPFAASEASKV